MHENVDRNSYLDENPSFAADSQPIDTKLEFRIDNNISYHMILLDRHVA